MLAGYLSRLKRGATLTGYGLVVGLIAIISLAAVTTTGEEVACLLDRSADAMNGEDWPGCHEYIFEATGRERDLSDEQVVNGYAVPPLSPGETITLTRSEPISNGSAEFQQTFTYPGNDAPVSPTGPESGLGVECETGFVATAGNDACVEQENAPIVVSFNHASNARTLTASWQGGSGYQDCYLAYDLGGGNYRSLGTVQCHDGNTPLNDTATLNSVDPGWGGESVVLMGTLQRDTGAGAQVMASFGNLSCDDTMGGSASPTPNTDEDCDSNFDNFKEDLLGAVTLTATPNETSSDKRWLASTSDTQTANGGGIYLASGGASSNTTSLAINSLYLTYMCQCFLNNTDYTYVNGSAEIILVHYGQSRTTSISRRTYNYGDPVRCSHGSSQWSFGGNVVYYQGVQSMQCAADLYF
ncbi:MAG: hypothetical protein Alpg2KO_06350 [Alphaproteobacteria bacterium]